jgi:hypothetical protein
MTKENINWDELRKKVDADLQRDIDEEISNVKSINNKYPEKGTVHFKTTAVYVNPFNPWGVKEEENQFWGMDSDTLEDEDFKDEGGELPELDSKEISKIVWNNRARPFSLVCKHLEDGSGDYDEGYIYPLTDNQEVCLCQDCNRELASKILEQLATEIFIK